MTGASAGFSASRSGGLIGASSPSGNSGSFIGTVSNFSLSSFLVSFSSSFSSKRISSEFSVFAFTPKAPFILSTIENAAITLEAVSLKSSDFKLATGSYFSTKAALSTAATSISERITAPLNAGVSTQDPSMNLFDSG